MAILRIQKLVPMLVAFAFVSASLLVAADPANAEGALFRAKRTWWFSNTNSWTDGGVEPPTGMTSFQPSAVGNIGTTTPNPSFTAPKSFIKETTYYFACGPGTFQCYVGYPESKGWYSYWNAKGSFRASNTNAPTTTTTIRFATTMLDPSAPPTGMYAPVTPTTTWSGRYDHSRGGSIMIWPGGNRFGGTMRFFEGPNASFYQLITIDGPYTTVTFPPKPTSQQIGTGVEMEIAEVEEVSLGFRYQKTEPYHTYNLIDGPTPCTPRYPSGPPCDYYVKSAHYLVTRAPYTTGMAQGWQPNGTTNTIQTGTGYDNRTAMGLNGTISMVHPRLIHAYTVFPPSAGKPIVMSWSSSRLRKIDFRFAPEPAGVAMLAAGFIGLAGLVRLRRR
jgi:hypothetical protein